MVWRFLKHYGVAKANEVLDEFAQSVVAFDPASASKAEVAGMEEELARLGHRLVEAEQEVRREHGETKQLETTYAELLSAARIVEDEILLAADGRPAVGDRAVGGEHHDEARRRPVLHGVAIAAEHGLEKRQADGDATGASKKAPAGQRLHQLPPSLA